MSRYGKASSARLVLQGCGEFFPLGVFDNGRGGRGSLAIGWEVLSGKFALMARMLTALRTGTNDRIVIVSNYTQTLDLFSTLCRERQVRPCSRLPVVTDGTCAVLCSAVLCCALLCCAVLCCAVLLTYLCRICCMYVRLQLLAAFS